MFYPSAKIIIKHPTDKKKILLVKRDVKGTFSYEPAGGKVEINFQTKIAENLEECAIREAREELGLVVSIDHYLGSYYFFWSIDPGKCSSCVLFIGTILEIDKNFKNNADTCELPLEPVWITVDDIVNRKIVIDKTHVGLENLILNYCNQFCDK